MLPDRSESKILETAGDVSPEILTSVEDCVDWFEEQRGLPTDEFIDRLCTTYADGWDIESYDNEAVRKIMRHARKIKRERDV